MTKERRNTSYLAVLFLLFCMNFFRRSLALDRGVESGSILSARGQCLSRCTRPRQYDKNRLWSHYLRVLQDVSGESICYQNCIKKFKDSRDQETKRKKRNTIANDGKYACNSTKETIGEKAGSIQNLSVEFLQKRTSKHGNMSWIANVTWSVYFSNENMYTADTWSGFNIAWFQNSFENKQPASTKVNCRFIYKNSTNFIIESGSSDWVYPNAIEVGVSYFPPTNETAIHGLDLIEFDPNRMSKLLIKKHKAIVPTNSSLTRTVVIIFGCFSGVVSVCIVFYFIWKKRSKPLLPHDQESFEYDASILYSTLDEKWVTEQLIPLLETQNDFKCFIHYRDFEVGRILHENMSDAVYKCRKILAVVSENFLGSNFCKEELDMALERVQRFRDYSLIVVNLDGVSIDRLPRALRFRTFVNLTNSQEQRTWRTRLVKQISVEENEAPIIKRTSFLRFTASKGCEVINNINELSTSSSESIV